ncbi:retron system putative HNH endonuclease [Salinicola tamaricis]|uniref:retron system putative HNH endonuclease n=1 Tax=Salinicola tamaricis TaxID=1771309 RepID=UPI000D0A6196|nr:retron system putative HNH endonuclease [Salinicola tamaricis]
MTAGIKRVAKQGMLSDQHGLCCYCEESLNIDNSHVEHLVPRNHAPELTLDWGNLAACCQNNSRCGHKRGSFHPVVNPYSDDCISWFECDFRGRLSVSENIPDEHRKLASDSRQMLGLDSCPDLIRRRERVILYVLRTWGEFFDDAAQDEGLFEMMLYEMFLEHGLPFRTSILSALHLPYHLLQHEIRF